MMAQKLMSENKDNPFNSRFFQPSDAMAAPQIQGFRNLMSKMETRDKQGTGANLYAGGAIASGFTPGAGVSDVLGYAPDPFNPGQTLPSFSENIDQGRYLDAGLQTVGAGGDVMLAASPFMPLLLAPAAAMKMTSQLGKALRSGSKATKTVDNAGEVAKVVPPTDKADGIFAFHGSPGNFDEFKLSKINTGEGAQAFGHGLYFTDSKDIAKFYKDSVSFQKGMEGQSLTYNGEIINVRDMQNLNVGLRKVMGALSDATPMNYPIKKDPEGLVKKTVETLTKKYRQQIKDLRSGEMGDFTDSTGFSNNERSALDLEKQLNEIEKVDLSKVGELDPKTYEVKINAVMDDLIDYDKPLGQQSDNIKNILNKMKSEVTVDDGINLGIDPFDYGGSDKKAIEATKNLLFGKDEDVVRFLNNWAAVRGEQSTGEKLLAKYGAKGIKYKADQGVGARNVPETGKNNYVIFDDKIIDIMAKYGIVGAIGVSAMQGASGGTEGDILPPGAI